MPVARLRLHAHSTLKVEAVAWLEGGFSFQNISVLFLERTCWCTIVSQASIWAQLPICLLEQSWVSYAALPSSPWGCSFSTPELLVVALHQALFIVSGFAFRSSSSFIHHLLLLTLLRELYGTGWDQFFFTTLRILTLADPAMPISPTYVAAGYPPL
jgi:hypothetical protein